MYVLGTAGHIDHGKSALVCALTGIDPDRLPEEKRREMTVDLGFAWFTLPSGRELSVVDVPGHERLVKNMLAGAGGINLALLIIAADEGVMPQTKEHLAILDLLNVEMGVVVVTKRDLVDEEVLRLAIMEAEQAVKGTRLGEAPIVAVSSVTGEGLSDLIAIIDRLLGFASPPRDIGRPRLAIDRIFTVRGFGTVVTGTLIDGRLRLQQEVEILPVGLRTRIRRLETHKRKIDTVPPGSRVAVNLPGISTEELQRGMVITSPGWLKPTQLLDVKLRAVSDLPCHITHNMSIAFYSGASEVPGRVRLLDTEKLGSEENGWAQIRLARPVAVVSGEPFVVRTSRATLGGGKIVDAHPKRHRRFETTVINSLNGREKGTPEDILLGTIESVGWPSEFERVILQYSFSEDEANKALQNLVEQKQVVLMGQGRHQFVVSRSKWEGLIEEVMRLLQHYHSQFPLRRGMPKEELRSRLLLSPEQFATLLPKLVEELNLVKECGMVRLPTHTITLSPNQQAEANAFLRTLAQNPYSPPTDSPINPELLNFLVEQRKVIRAGKITFCASAYEEMVNQIIAYVKAHGKITMAEARDLFRSTRKYMQPLLEHLDQQKITYRAGDERFLK